MAAFGAKGTHSGVRGTGAASTASSATAASGPAALNRRLVSAATASALRVTRPLTMASATSTTAWP
eukprot:11174136-Lingulodinium_polyedra.AAC.1